MKRAAFDPSSDVADMFRRLHEIVRLGVTGDQLDAAVRAELVALAAKAEDEIGYLIPRTGDMRVVTVSDN
jgi:hypothetical protein